MRAGPRPFHRQQHRTTPFAADADPLDQPQHGQDDGTPDADLGVARHEANGKGREAGQQQGCDQGRLAADAVAVMAKECRPDRAGDKADGVNGESLQGADQRIGSREIHFAKTSPATCPSKKSYASMTVPTVLATTARRSCALCSASDRPTAAISAVVILSPPVQRALLAARRGPQ